MLGGTVGVGEGAILVGGVGVGGGVGAAVGGGGVGPVLAGGLGVEFGGGVGVDGFGLVCCLAAGCIGGVGRVFCGAGGGGDWIRVARWCQRMWNVAGVLGFLFRLIFAIDEHNGNGCDHGEIHGPQDEAHRSSAGLGRGCGCGWCGNPVRGSGAGRRFRWRWSWCRMLWCLLNGRLLQRWRRFDGGSDFVGGSWRGRCSRKFYRLRTLGAHCGAAGGVVRIGEHVATGRAGAT